MSGVGMCQLTAFCSPVAIHCVCWVVPKRTFNIFICSLEQKQDVLLMAKGRIFPIKRPFLHYPAQFIKNCILLLEGWETKSTFSKAYSKQLKYGSERKHFIHTANIPPNMQANQITEPFWHLSRCWNFYLLKTIYMYTPAPAEHGLNCKVTATLLVLFVAPSKWAVQNLRLILSILQKNMGESQGHITPGVSGVMTGMNKIINITYYW